MTTDKILYIKGEFRDYNTQLTQVELTYFVLQFLTKTCCAIILDQTLNTNIQTIRIWNYENRTEITITTSSLSHKENNCNNRHNHV